MTTLHRFSPHWLSASRTSPVYEIRQPARREMDFARRFGLLGALIVSLILWALIIGGVRWGISALTKLPAATPSAAHGL